MGRAQFDAVTVTVTFSAGCGEREEEEGMMSVGKWDRATF